MAARRSRAKTMIRQAVVGYISEFGPTSDEVLRFNVASFLKRDDWDSIIQSMLNDQQIKYDGTHFRLQTRPVHRKELGEESRGMASAVIHLGRIN